MRQGILVLNVLMIIGTAVLAERLISGWEAFEETNSLERLGGHVEPGQQTPTVVIDLEEEARPFPEFLIISERNLFTPQRGPESEEEAEPEEEKPPVLPMKPALIGVSMMNGERRAFLTVYEGKKSQGKSRSVTIGDDVQGYKVSEINDTTVLLTWRDQEVIIFDTKGAPQQASAASKGMAVTVITVGAAPAAVETTTAAASKDKEGRGLEVGVAGAAGGQAGSGGRAASVRQGGMGRGGRGQAGGGRGGLGRGGRGRGGLGGGRGQSGYGGQGGRGLPGNLGISGGRGQSGLQNSGGRRY